MGQAVQEDSCWKAGPEDKVIQPLDTSVSTVQERASFCCEKLESRTNQYATHIDSKVGTTILFMDIENSLHLLQSASRRIEPRALLYDICPSLPFKTSHPVREQTPLTHSHCTFTAPPSCKPPTSGV